MENVLTGQEMSYLKNIQSEALQLYVFNGDDLSKYEVPILANPENCVIENIKTEEKSYTELQPPMSINKDVKNICTFCLRPKEEVESGQPQSSVNSTGKADHEVKHKLS